MRGLCDTPCNAFDFKENVLGESSNLDSGTRRLVVPKELGIGVIDGDKVVHVLQEQLSSQRKTHSTPHAIHCEMDGT